MSAPQFPHAPSGAPTPTPRTSNGVALAGFVLALIGLLICWIPIINVLGIILGILGAVLAGIGLVRSESAGSGKGLAIAGIVLGVLAVLLSLVISVAFTQAVDDALNDGDVPHSTVSASPGAADSKGTTADSSTGSKPSFKNGLLITREVKIEITSHKVIPVGAKGNEYGDKPVIAFWFKITNLTAKDVTPLDWVTLFSAYQDNNPDAVNQLDVASLPDDRFLDTQFERIKKGGTVENAAAYELDDTSTPVELVANDTLGIADDLGRVTYRLK